MSHYDTLADLYSNTPPSEMEESRELILQQIEILYKCKALSDGQRDKLIELWSPTYDEFEELK